MRYLSNFISRRIAIIALVLLISLLTVAKLISSWETDIISVSKSNVVTADIQAGIEKHIDEKTRQDGGYFFLPFEDKQLKLKLVRVHTEYLSRLGPKSFFACVDLVDISGDVYDVDFFLAGEIDNMTVTETIVHKINGQPFYAWKQKTDGTWGRIPVEKASPREIGIITGRDEFEFLYRVTLPRITGAGKMWIPLPTTNRFQEVKVKSIKTSGKQKILKDTKYNNHVVFLELEPSDSGRTIEIVYLVNRIEQTCYEETSDDPQKYLAPESLVPNDKIFSDIASNVVKGKKGALVKARAIYDYVIDSLRYQRYGSGWGKGDAVYVCNVRAGNCTDFHSLFIALARASGIPARFVMGAAIPSERDDGGIDGYHCWAEFYAEEKWWPVDISEADKYSMLATYYFGHLPANRFEFSRGRDLVVNPGPVFGPINFLAYPILEIEGKQVKVIPELFFKRTVS